MKIGLSPFTYHFAFSMRKLNVFTFIDKASELGVDGLQISIPSIDDEVLSKIKSKLDELDFYLELSTEGCDVEKFRNLLKAGAKIGATAVRTFIQIGRPKSLEQLKKQVEAAIPNFKEIGKIAEDYGIRVGIENHQDLTSLEMLELLHQIDNDYIGVCLDTGNSLGVMEDPIDAAENLAPYTYTTHFKDYKIVATEQGASIIGCSLGEGIVDFPKIVDILRKRSPIENLNIEAVIEKLEMPFMDLSFWDSYVNRTPKDVIKILKLIKKNNLDPSLDYSPLSQRGASEEEILKEEEETNKKSVKYLRMLIQQHR